MLPCSLYQFFKPASDKKPFTPNKKFTPNSK
jgi:hypothetical protein